VATAGKMALMRLASRGHGLLLAGLVMGSACSDRPAAPTSSATAGAAPCVTGEPGCACYGNRTCDRGSRCEKKLCVVDAGSGGSADEASGAAGPEAGESGSGASLGGSGAVSGAPVGDAGDANGGRAGSPPVGGAGSTSGGSASPGGGSGGAAGSGGGNGVAGNMISNGNFDAELQDWVANPDIGDISSDGTKGRVCFVTDSSGQFTLAWPSDFSLAFTIKPGKSYRLSYRAVSTLGIEISVQIRMPSSPYTFYFNERETLTQTWAAHSHTFSLSSGGSNRGIAFIGAMSSAGTTCFDDVLLEALP